VQKLWNCLGLAAAPPVGAELPPVGVWPPPAGVVAVLLGAAPPVGAELPPEPPVLELVVDDELVPVVFEEPDEDDGPPELVAVLEPEPELDPEPEPEPELELLEPVPVVSPVVPVVVPVGEVDPVGVVDELPSPAMLAEAVGSTRSGTVFGIWSETWAPPQAVRTSPPRRAPSSAAGRARLTNASFRLGPCAARTSGSR